MTINVSKHYNQHIKKLDQNNFIYKVKKSFYLLTNQEERLYEVGFSEGFLHAVNILQKKFCEFIALYTSAFPQLEKMEQLYIRISKKLESISDILETEL